MLYGAGGSVRSLNRWDHEWLALLPEFNVKQHRSVARELARFFKFISRWKSDTYSVNLSGIVRVDECIQLIWQSYENNCRKFELSYKIDCRDGTGLVGRYAVLRKACFLPLEYILLQL